MGLSSKNISLKSLVIVTLSFVEILASLINLAIRNTCFVLYAGISLQISQYLVGFLLINVHV